MKRISGAIVLLIMLLALMLVPAIHGGCGDLDAPGESSAVEGVDPGSGEADSDAAGTIGEIGTGAAATGGVPLDPAKLGAVERDVTYCTAGGVDLKMDVYYPNSLAGSADVAATTGAMGQVPAVLYVHGGGWTRGDKSDGAGAAAIPALRDAGFLVASINYRLAPEFRFPAQIEDVKCAVRYLRANADSYSLNPDRIGAWGGSAGGHLVSLLGVTDASAGLEGSGGYPDESSRVQAVVDMFGPADLSQEFEGGAIGSTLGGRVFGATDRGSEILRAASPVTYISADDPPFLILHGDSDALVPVSQSQELYDRLTSAGIPARLVIVANAGHGFVPDGGDISPSRQELGRMIVEFFTQQLM